MHPRRSDAKSAAQKAAAHLVSLGHTVAADSLAAADLHLPEVEGKPFGNCDLAVTFGGDGTLIRAAQWCSEFGTPILGVYFGRFGFVTQCDDDQLISKLEEFIGGTQVFEERMMLQTDLLRNGQSIITIQSLNETVVQRSVTAQMMTFQVDIDGQPITRYPADGVLVCTPTGSTAYNLSVGGPIMDPNVDAIILTAIAPHTLSSRPLVLGGDSNILLSMETFGESVLSSDGQTRLHLLSGDRLQIRKSPLRTKLLQVRKNDFLDKLNSRLLWSKSLGGDER